MAGTIVRLWRSARVSTPRGATGGHGASGRVSLACALCPRTHHRELLACTRVLFSVSAEGHTRRPVCCEHSVSLVFASRLVISSAVMYPLWVQAATMLKPLPTPSHQPQNTCKASELEAQLLFSGAGAASAEAEPVTSPRRPPLPTSPLRSRLCRASKDSTRARAVPAASARQKEARHGTPASQRKLTGSATGIRGSPAALRSRGEFEPCVRSCHEAGSRAPSRCGLPPIASERDARAPTAACLRSTLQASCYRRGLRDLGSSAQRATPHLLPLFDPRAKSGPHGVASPRPCARGARRRGVSGTATARICRAATVWSLRPL